VLKECILNLIYLPFEVKISVINFFYLQNVRCLKNRTWKSWIKYIIWSMSENYHTLFCLFFLDLGGMLVDNASFVQWTQCFKYLAYYKYLAKIMKNVVWCRGEIQSCSCGGYFSSPPNPKTLKTDKQKKKLLLFFGKPEVRKSVIIARTPYPIILIFIN